MFASSDRDRGDSKGTFGGSQGPADKDSLCSYHSNNYNYGHITAAQHDYTYIDSNQMQSVSMQCATCRKLKLTRQGRQILERFFWN